MKNFFWTAVLLILFVPASLAQENNDFYGRSPAKTLKGPLKIDVSGEVANPGPVDLEKLPRHALIARETRLVEDRMQFVGAYRYEGYSLFDILKEKIVAKKNGAEFRPVIDLLISVENGQGEKVVLSWGEIYYPAALHRLLVADRAAPIIPSESKDQWPLPEKTKLVCGNDLVTERNIDQPVKIIVYSAPQSFKTVKGLKPFYAPSFKLYREGKEIAGFRPEAAGAEKRVFPSVFYGRGMGFHGFQDFSGVLLKDVLKKFVPRDVEAMRKGVLVIAAVDGYRAAVAWSELFNRNDQAEFLLVDRGENADGGRFSLFPGIDFFSDRAVKALSAIYFIR